MDKVFFREEQRFTQIWIWLLLIASLFAGVVPLWYGVYQQVYLGKPFGDNPGSDTGLIIVSVFTTLLMFGLLALFRVSKLIMEVREDGIHFRYPPFILKWRMISKDEIERFTVGKYSPVGEYGGWGVRRSFGKYGRAYNVKGNQGLRLYMKNGKVLLLGTQRSQALTFAMQKLMSPKETIR
jgi:hypothetical protein